MLGSSFQVNETCLSGDHRTFVVSPNDRDSHNPILIHVTPADMTCNERRIYSNRTEGGQERT